ncbi:MAG: glycosyltransferase family A protein [Planctomycetota bacterium]
MEREQIRSATQATCPQPDRSSPSLRPQDRPRTSVCIAVCTRNRAAQLQRALESLVQQAAGQDTAVEYLVINNGSEDRTAEVIASFQTRHPHLKLRVVWEPQVGFAPVRSRVFEETTADWIAFCDDDQVAEPDWLHQLWATANRRRTNCVGGRVVLRFEETAFRPGDFCRRLLGETSAATEQRFQRGSAPGMGNVLLRRVTIHEIGGVDRRYGGRGEDTRLFHRLTRGGQEAWFAPQAIVEHVIPAERNVPAAYRTLARESADAADLSWSRWQWLLPLVAITRLTGVVVVNLPRLAWRSCFAAPAERLDQECVTIFNLWRACHELRFFGRVISGIEQ